MLTWIGQLMNSRNFTPFAVDDVSHWQNAMEEVTREDNHGTDYNHFLLEGFSRGEQLFPGQLSANVAWYMDVIGDDNSRGVFVQIDLAGSGAQVKVWQNSMLSPWRDIAISDDFRAQVEQNTRDIENLYQELAEAVEHAEAYTDEKLVEAKAYTDQQIDASMAEVREVTAEAKQIATEAAQTASEARDIATEARQSADDAYTAAMRAEFNAEAANASATQAAQSAAEAQRQAESAESQVEVARAAAESAQASAEHAEEVAINKTEKKLLSYNGTNILAPDGSVLTFAQLYDWLMNDPYFVVLVYNNYAYHPNGVSTSQIVFSSEFPVNGYDRAHRITMLPSGLITMTETESEHTISRVNVISDANKGSTVQYPSVKAVADYVEHVKDQVDLLKRNVWNAVEHGCKGDASMDCTSIFQQAVNSEPDGTVFYFPKGRYLLNTITFQKKNNITICGDGYSWLGGTILQSKSDYSFLIFYGGTYVTIENLMLYKYEVKPTSRGIYFADDTPTTMDCRMIFTTVENVAVQGFRQGITFGVPSGYNYFRKVRVSQMGDNGIGFSIGGGYTNVATNPYGEPIPPNYIYLDECSVDNIGTGTGTGISISCGQEIWIRACDVCNFTNGTAVKLQNNNSVNKRCEHVYLSDNSLYNNKTCFNAISSDADIAISGISMVNNMLRGANVDGGVGVQTVKANAACQDFRNINIVGNVMVTFADSWTPAALYSYDRDTAYIAGIGFA